MDLWFLYAFISSVFAWLAAFLVKISAEKDHNSFLFTTYSFFSLSFSSFVYYLFSWVYIDKLLLLFSVSIIMWFTYLITIITKLESLKNISTVFYFPIYKVFSTIVAFLVWIYFFNDSFSITEIIWIIFWLFVPVVLITKKEKLKQNNIVKGIILCLISWIFAVVAVSMSKIVNLNELNLYFYMTMWWLIWWLLSLFKYKRKKNLKIKSISKIKIISILNWFLVFVWSTFFIKALSWNVWVVYTINSFSILIPIVLSVIFYNEKLNFRKIIAIVLTIVSMLFFRVF
jgi:drug/metabolite transporter (DMT)-like permease